MPRKKRSKATLRASKPLFERVKLPLIFLAYLVLFEWADPLPFYITLPARLAVAGLILFTLREFHHARMEVDPDWVRRTQKNTDKWKKRAARIPHETWLKLQRVGMYLVSGYMFGMMLNVLTDRCDSALQCAVLAPRMAIENLPTFIQFAVMMALALFQIALMMYALVKVGSFKVVMPGTVPITFDDVWGQDAAKRKVMEQVKLLEDSGAIEAHGGYMPKGLLLYGPPGTGKTYLAKAAANYSSKPLILVPPGAFQSTFVGINLLKVWTLFRSVRKLARRYGGVIVFIDEIDSLGSRGGEVEGMAVPEPRVGCVPLAPLHTDTNDPLRVIGVGMNQMGTLEAFLAAMDGMEEPRGAMNRMLVFLGFRPMHSPEYKYLMMGATNRLTALDPALLRAGRFGRKIHVPYPKLNGRRRTYEGYLERVRNDLSEKDIDWAARNHAKGTGAEVKDIVNEALLVTYRDDRKDPGVIHFTDLMKAMLWVKMGESDGPFDRAEGRWAVAVHEAGHAVAFHFLNRHRQHIWFASIEQHGSAGGMVAPTPLRDDWLLMKSEMLADVQVALASRVAEELVLGEATNGHGGDGKAATERAVEMVKYGHGTQLGMMDTDKADFHKQVEGILTEALGAVRILLTEHRENLEAVARLLLERGTVPGDEIHEMLEEA